MSKTLVKLMVWGLLLSLTAAAAWVVVRDAGQLLAYFQQGANPAAAFNIIPNVPPDLEVALNWLPDDSDTGRALDPYTREQIQSAYLRAWLQWNFSYRKGQPYGLTTYFAGPALDQATQAVSDATAEGWRVEQADTTHTLRLHLYSADGSIATFTDTQADVAEVVRDHSGAVAFTDDAHASYDVVMLQEDGNWRVRHMLRLAAPAEALTDALAPAQPAPGFVARNGTQLARDGAPYPVAGINYYPQATPWQQFWPQYNPVTIDHDFALIASLGLNTVRIFVPFAQFGGAHLDPAMAAHLDDLLARAAGHRLTVIITLFDFRAQYDPLSWPPADRQLQALAARYAGNSTILAWDLKNEPDLDDQQAGADEVDAWLRHAAGLIRAADPQHLITIGWSNPLAAARLTHWVDFVSFHYYGPAASLAAQYAQLRAAAPGQPLVLQEFGLPTWNSFFFPNGHSEPEQAEYYADILDSLRTTDGAGYLAWTLYDFPHVPAGVAGPLPWQSAPQAHMGLARLDGSLKPAAALVRPGAPLQAPRLPSWARFLKPFWLSVLLVALLLAWVAPLFARRRGNARPRRPA